MGVCSARHNFQYVARDVVLFAPLWRDDDPVPAVAQEQQAIGRVFRSGQTRTVRCHRILLTGPKGEPTIDDALYMRNVDKDTIQAATSAD